MATVDAPQQSPAAERLHRLAEKRARLLAERRRIDGQLAALDAAETVLLLDGGGQ